MWVDIFRTLWYVALGAFAERLETVGTLAALAVSKTMIVWMTLCILTLWFLRSGRYALYAACGRATISTLVLTVILTGGHVTFSQGTGAAFLVAVLASWSIIALGTIYSWREKKQAGSTSGETGRGSTDLRRFVPEKPKYNFSSIKGMADFKDKANKVFKEIKEKNRNGILLTGEPGNGKTTMANAIAGELGLKIFSVTGGDFASRWINQTTEQLRTLFAEARSAAPCVLFFDEIETLIKDRSRLSDGNGEALQIVDTMLTNLVALRGTGVIIIGASNHLDMLDPAAAREGRFDFKIEVPPPDLEARTHLLQAFLPAGTSYEPVVVDRVARRWEGFSVVRIQSAVEKAAEMAREAGTTIVSFDTLAAALREIQGSLGDRLPENTLTLGQMTFEPKIREQLDSIANRMMNIDEIEEAGGTVPRGVLFYGPPGTGKTATAKAIAKTSQWAFIGTSGQELLADADAIENLLKKASNIRPAVVFIDEADDILQDRGANPWSKAATNRLLQAIDGTTPLHDIVLIAATNHPDVLDGAALRGGRFSEMIEFALPGETEIVRLVADFRARSRAKFAADWSDIDAAKMLLGLAPADIRDRLQKAVNSAIGRTRENREVLVDDIPG